MSQKRFHVFTCCGERRILFNLRERRVLFKLRYERKINDTNSRHVELLIYEIERNPKKKKKKVESRVAIN